jgi:hypothetical protein
MLGYLYLLGFIAVLLVVFFILPPVLRDRKVARLRREGCKTRALVLESFQIGGSQFKVLVQLKLRIKPEGAPEFEAMTGVAVPHVKLQQFSPGGEIAILYNRLNPLEFVVDPEKL